LMAVAKRRALDHLRRNQMLDRKHLELGRELEERQGSAPTEPDVTFDSDVDDDLLRLIFTACHPILSSEARVALTLRMLGGLTTAGLARGFLVWESTVAEGIVRAKRTLAEKQVPFEIPHGTELGGGLSSVFEVIYLIFNEGYSATAGDEWVRPS